MTPKERRDAKLELLDWATDPEFRDPDDTKGIDARRKRWDRARLLRSVALELDRVPEPRR